MTGLKLVASALAEDTSAVSTKGIGFSRDLYINGVEYILRGLPRSSTVDIDLNSSEPFGLRETTYSYIVAATSTPPTRLCRLR